MLFLHLDFVSVPIFYSKVVLLPFIRLLVWSPSFSLNLLFEFSLVILETPVLIVLLDPVSVSFKSPFFRQYLSIYLFMLYCQTCLLFCFGLFISKYPCVFPFLRIFPCYTFFTCPSRLISHSGFIFLYGFLRGTAVLSQTNFAPA